MLGFKKKKKKETKKDKKPGKKDQPEQEEKNKGKDETDTGDGPDKKLSPEIKKKRLSKKLIFIILMIFIAVGASFYVVYIFYFSSAKANGKTKIYTKLELKYVHLPEEMVRFSFKYFPDLYDAMVTFNSEMNLLETEIIRIDGIGKKYPDQKKISDKEKKVWEKARNALLKAFIKIEKPVKEIYVLFQVNKELGMAKIKAKKKELTGLALTALTPAKKMTKKLKSDKTIPKGLIKGTIFRLKKKFL